MVNTNKLKGRMRELGITQADAANNLKIAQSTLNQKLNNARPFDLDEAEKLSELLDIAESDFSTYFFNSSVA